MLAPPSSKPSSMLDPIEKDLSTDGVEFQIRYRVLVP